MNVRKILVPVSIVVLASGLMLAAGCRQPVGTIGGAAVGAVVGHQFGSGSGKTLMTMVGAIAGAMIGRHLVESDRHKVAETLETNRTGETTTWTNPDTGVRYAVTPTRTSMQNGTPCRTFVFKSYEEAEPQSVTRVACKQPNGSWKVQ